MPIHVIQTSGVVVKDFKGGRSNHRLIKLLYIIVVIIVYSVTSIANY